MISVLGIWAKLASSSVDTASKERTNKVYQAREEGYFDGIGLHGRGEYQQLDHKALIDEIVKSILAGISAGAYSNAILCRLYYLSPH
jgi:hypothetical protein